MSEDEVRVVVRLFKMLEKVSEVEQDNFQVVKLP